MSAPAPPAAAERGSLPLGFLFGMGLDFLWYWGDSYLSTAWDLISKASGLEINTLMVWMTYRAFGITQWIFVGPALLYFRRRQQSNTLRGLLLQAVVVMLVNFYFWTAQGGLPALGR